MRKRLVRLLAALPLAVGLGVVGAVSASAAPVTSVTVVAHAKPAEVSPFTGSPTTDYIVKDAVSYFHWEYSPNDSYCIFDDGADADMYTCDGTSNDYFAAIPYALGTSWAGNFELRSSVGDCLYDPSGQNNIRLEMTACSEVGGQSWDPIDISGYTVWANGIELAKNHTVPLEAVTDASGDQKQGAWIVSYVYDSSPPPAYERWLGPGSV
jgi:hypothetical protein